MVVRERVCKGESGIDKKNTNARVDGRNEEDPRGRWRCKELKDGVGGPRGRRLGWAVLGMRECRCVRVRASVWVVQTRLELKMGPGGCRAPSTVSDHLHGRALQESRQAGLWEERELARGGKSGTRSL